MLFFYLPRFTRAAMEAATLSAATAVASGVTIAHRMTLLTMQADIGSGRGSEAVRMVAEKMEAAAEGAFGAAVETGRLVMRSALTPMSPDQLAHGLVSIGVAATRPAARRAKANAKRLSRRTRRKA